MPERSPLVGRLIAHFRRVVERPDIGYLLGQILDAFQLRLQK